jgi:hypothetical protein
MASAIISGVEAANSGGGRRAAVEAVGDVEVLLEVVFQRK